MSKIIRFIWRILHLTTYSNRVDIRIRVIESQLDFLSKSANRKTRRKFYRMCTNKKSPFYIGRQMEVLQ